MSKHEAWRAAIEAAAKVIHHKRSGTHAWSADEIAAEALQAAWQAATAVLMPAYDSRD